MMPGMVMTPEPFTPQTPIISVPQRVGNSVNQAVGASPYSLRGVAASTAAGNGQSQAELALLRMAQRLLGRNAHSRGPGVDVLRLFCASPDEVLLDELLSAVSVLPLGVSRAEVQLIFIHLRGSKPTSGVLRTGATNSRSPDSVPFLYLTSALESANLSGLPAEAEVLEQIDLNKLFAGLNRLDANAGGVSPSEFRVMVMQAEPFLTAWQLDWLIMLTDKDGEGRLQPRSLLQRLGGSGPPRASPDSNPGEGTSVSSSLAALLGQRAGFEKKHGQVLPRLPRQLVVSALVARVRERLQASGPKLTLESVFSLFELSENTDSSGVILARSILASLLAHLRLGISAAEAHELVASLPSYVLAGATPDLDAAQSFVQLKALYAAISASGGPDQEAQIAQFREAAAAPLVNRGQAFAVAVLVCCPDSEWIPEAEFRRALRTAFTGVSASFAPTRFEGNADEAEDRLVLLAEKNPMGQVRWRPFATVGGWVETEVDCLSPKKGLTPVKAQSDTQQSWRKARPVSDAANLQNQPGASPSPAKQPPGVTVGTTTLGKQQRVDAPLKELPSAPQSSGGFGCCRRKWVAYLPLL